MKKSLALLLSLILVLGLFAGCNKDVADSTTTVPTVGNIYEDSTPAGTLYLTFSAAIEIIYDDAGKALQITGTNEVGKTVAAANQDQLGRDCVFVARALIRYAAQNQLLADAKTVAVRVGNDDPHPTDDFLEVIITDCQYLVDEECTGLRMIQLDQDRINSDGDLTPEAAALLASVFLGAAEADLAGEQTPVDGAYTYTWGDKACTVDAFTGLVTMK